MRKITITAALNEIKLYDAKINKAIDNGKFIGAAKKSSDKIGAVSKETFNNNAISSYQSITDLIKNRSAMKAAIVKSNAVACVTVNSKIMTVAEAIERKNSIIYEQNLLTMLKMQYTDAVNKVNKENDRVSAKVDELLIALVGKDSQRKLTKEEQEALEVPYRTNNEFALVDPLDVHEIITTLEADIEGFLAEVDTQLAVANAVTMIEVE